MSIWQCITSGTSFCIIHNQGTGYVSFMSLLWIKSFLATSVLWWSNMTGDDATLKSQFLSAYCTKQSLSRYSKTLTWKFLHPSLRRYTLRVMYLLRCLHSSTIIWEVLDNTTLMREFGLQRTCSMDLLWLDVDSLQLEEEPASLPLPSVFPALRPCCRWSLSHCPHLTCFSTC